MDAVGISLGSLAVISQLLMSPGVGLEVEKAEDRSAAMAQDCSLQALPVYVHSGDTPKILLPPLALLPRAELRPARRQARLPHSRSLLLPGRER